MSTSPLVDRPQVSFRPHSGGIIAVFSCGMATGSADGFSCGIADGETEELLVRIAAVFVHLGKVRPPSSIYLEHIPLYDSNHLPQKIHRC